MEYFAKIEGEGNGNTNFRSLGLQLDAVLENRFWDEVLDGKRIELQTNRELILQSTKDDPLLRPNYTRTPIDKASGLKLVMDGFETKVKNLGFDEIQMKEQGTAIQKRMSYPEYVMMNHSFESSQIVETTVEQMAIQQNETVENVHAIEQTETVSMAYSCKSTAKEPVKRENAIVPISIETIFSHERLVKYRGLFDGKLSISQNALCTFLGDTPQKSGFVNGYIKPLRYIAELDNNTFVLIDTQEAEDILKNKFSVRSLYLVQQGFLIGGGHLSKGLERQARLLNGDLNRDLRPLEKDWIEQTHSYRAFPT